MACGHGLGPPTPDLSLRWRLRLRKSSALPSFPFRASLRCRALLYSHERQRWDVLVFDREILTRTSATAMDLPPPDTKRWVARRKAVVVNAVRSGAISLEEVCRRYELSVEEFLAWQRAIDTHGVAGLRVTRLQIYHDTPPARLAKPRY